MNAQDIMTAKVISVAPDTPVREVAGILDEHRISAVPVIEDGALVGIVSEGDLLRRREIGTQPGGDSGSWWLRLFVPDHAVHGYVKSHARLARDVMTREVVSVAPETPAAVVAGVLERRRIGRVPVISAGRVVGIISRANLVQALARASRAQPAGGATRDDRAIRAELIRELEQQPWWRTTGGDVIVSDGVVHFWGLVDTDEARTAARIAAENVPGVHAVRDHRLMSHELPVMT